MKKYITLYLYISLVSFGFSQTKPSVKNVKDSIKTEVVNVVTSYAPKVTDASKIKKKPIIKLSNNVGKKVLEYSITSVPVASTFIPKSGTMKGIDLGKRERLFDNYLALGFGNNITPYLETFIHRIPDRGSEYGVYAKVISTTDPVDNTVLSSSFYTIDANFFYKQQEHFFNWKAGFIAKRDKYNWYALPSNINFTNGTIDAIEPEQTYKTYTIFGNIEVPDSYIKEGKLGVTYFSDALASSEFNVDFTSEFLFPTGRFGQYLDDIQLGFSLNYLGGNFENSYKKLEKLTYGFISTGLHPRYEFTLKNFDVRLGLKGCFSMDVGNDKNRFFIYPDIEISYPIIPKYTNLYIGAFGDLHTNSFNIFAKENPYVSPTLDIRQTNEVYNFFGGVRGMLSSDITYNVKGSYKNEENKPFYILNKSKSNGFTTAATVGGFPFFGYEFGNSFFVRYDNVKTLNVFGEITYDATKNVSIGFNGAFNMYTLNNEEYAWHLPKIKSELFAKYKQYKWYAGTNIYYVGKRIGLTYQKVTQLPSATSLKGYVDINVHGGYHFHDGLSVFVKANNLMNINYQRFTNFNTQSIQVIGGISWKFDSIF